ncbi:MAG: dihydrolipoyl dehydrogenase [Acidobacteriota bacterium]
MASILEVKVPDLGEVDDVEVTEVLVAAGDRVEADQPLITLESDKASMDVPSPAAGTVTEVAISAGDSAAEGTLVLRLETAADQEAPAAAAAEPASAPVEVEEHPAELQGSAPREIPSSEGSGADTAAGFEQAAAGADLACDVLVLGSGPGGYTAAFRAADLGLEVILVEKHAALGGVCLNVGCIPSKALLHIAKLIDDAREAADHGVSFGAPQVDLDRLREWKGGVVGRLTGGLGTMAKQRKVTTLTGVGALTGPHSARVETSDGEKTLAFRNAILATGSRSVQLPGFPEDERLVDSTGALELRDIPERLLIIGGGIIGLEMSQVYCALGSKITVVELLPHLMPGADRDLVRPLQKRLAARYENIWTETKVTRLEAVKGGLRAHFEGPQAPESALFDRVLLSVGRAPNGHGIGAETAGVEVDERGFIRVDKQLRTNVPHIFAIGDLVGQPMLAHKATHEGKVAAQVAAGEKSFFDARVIPSVAYTDPEVAWVGLTETEAKESGRKVGKGSFPWAASGRSLASGRSEGLTKLLFDPESKRILGGGIVGPHAGDLIAEIALAIEMGCDAEDLGLTIHPHPTLSESVGMAAEAFEGTITDLYLPKRR